MRETAYAPDANAAMLERDPHFLGALIAAGRVRG
jgi:hypothetical protein